MSTSTAWAWTLSTWCKKCNSSDQIWPRLCSQFASSWHSSTISRSFRDHTLFSRWLRARKRRNQISSALDLTSYFSASYVLCSAWLAQPTARSSLSAVLCSFASFRNLTFVNPTMTPWLIRTLPSMRTVSNTIRRWSMTKSRIISGINRRSPTNFLFLIRWVMKISGHTSREK